MSTISLYCDNQATMSSTLAKYTMGNQGKLAYVMNMYDNWVVMDSIPLGKQSLAIICKTKSCKQSPFTKSLSGDLTRSTFARM